jgi:hypothetical protein
MTGTSALRIACSAAIPQPVVEHHRADPVAGRDRGVGQHERGGQRVLEPGKAAGELRHRAAGVDENVDGLRLLDRELASDRVPALRRRLPVDVPRVVAWHVVP